MYPFGPMARRQDADTSDRDGVADDAATGGQPQGANRDSLLDRRDYLRLSGAAVAAVAGGAAAGTAAAAERHGIQFDRVVDAVDDLGMDPNGGSPIDGALDRAYESGTLVEFPPGDYLVTRTHAWSAGVDSFGVVGTGDHRNDVQFVFPDGWADLMFNVRNGRNHLFENFTWQQTDDRQTGVANVLQQADGLHVENVELAGFNPGRAAFATLHIGLIPTCTTTGGVNVVKDFVCTGGGVLETLYPTRRIPMFLGPGHRGELRLIDAHVENSGEHSIYASRTNGCIRVEGGLFRNNDNTNMRVSTGHDSKQSWVKGARIEIDTEAAPDTGRYQNTRGIRVESGFQGWSGLLVEDCDFVMKSSPSASALAEITHTHGAVTFRNCRFRQDQDGIPIISAAPPEGGVETPHDVELDGVSITGSAANTRGAVNLNGRDGSSITNCCIEREHGDGIVVSNSSGCEVRDTNVTVPGRATVFDNADVSTSNVTSGGSCPLPGSGDSGSGDGSGGSGGSGDGSGGLDHELRISGGSGSNVVSYSFSVDGELEGTMLLNSEDSVDGTSASGAVAGGTDSYLFSGSVTEFGHDGDLTVELDGQEVDPAQWGGSDGSDGFDGSDGGSATPDRELRISGGSRSNVVSYSFSVDGELEGTMLLNSEDSVDGTSASGAVAGGTDSYLFSGSVTEFGHDGDLTVELDGQEVDPAQWGGSDGGSGDGSGGSGDALPNSLVVDGRGSGRSTYSFSVSGEVAKDGERGSINDEDVVSGSDVEGLVVGGVDAYRFSGDVTAFELSGGASVSFEDNDG